MNIVVLMGVFFILLLLGVPIAYLLCLSVALYMAFFMGVPTIIIGQQMLKRMDSFTLTAIPFFIIVGGLTESGGISKQIVSFARAVVGHLPGGLAIVTVVASMASITMAGAGTATTATAGGITIPSMREEGYDGGYASAVQTVGGIFGPPVPLSTLMALYGVVSGESVGDMLLTGLVPSLFLGTIVVAVIVWRCVKKGYKRVDHSSLKWAAKSFLDTIWATLAPATILGGIYSGPFTPAEASVVAYFYCLIIGLFVYRELNFKSPGKVVFKLAETAAGIVLIVTAIQVPGWVLTGVGIPQMVAKGFTPVISSSTMFTFVVVFILIIAGCFIDAISTLLIFAPILIPTATQCGISLIHFGVVMVVILCIGLVTPPMGTNLSAASPIGGQPIHKITPHLPVPIASIIAGAIAIILIPSISALLPALIK